MAIARDTFLSLGDQNSGTTLTASYTMGVVSNGLLVVNIVGDAVGGNDDIVSVTYAGAGLTLIAKQTSSVERYHYLYYKLGPASGANNVVITCTNSHVLAAMAASYSGVSALDASATDLYSGSSGTFTTSALTTIANNCAVVCGLTNTYSGGLTVHSAISGCTFLVEDTTFYIGALFETLPLLVTPAGAPTLAMFTTQSENLQRGVILASFSPAGGGSAVSAANSTVSAAPITFTAIAGSSVITITALDSGSAPVQGVTVTPSSTGTGNGFNPTSGPSNSGGQFTTTFTSSVAEAKTVSAVADGVTITQTAAVTVTSATVSAGNSTVNASPSSIVVNSGTSTVTVVVKNASNQAVQGASVVLSSTGTGNTFTPSNTVVSDSNGSAVFGFSSSVVESKTLSATASAVSITQTAAVTVTNPAGAVVRVLLPDGVTTVDITAASGTVIPIKALRVNQTGTTASNLIALYY